MLRNGISLLVGPLAHAYLHASRTTRASHLALLLRPRATCTPLRLLESYVYRALAEPVLRLRPCRAPRARAAPLPSPCRAYARTCCLPRTLPWLPQTHAYARRVCLLIDRARWNSRVPRPC